MRRIQHTLLVPLISLSAFAADFDPGRFEKVLIVPACNDPMQLEVTADSRVFFIERNGALKLYEPKSQAVTVIGRVPALLIGEVGLLGLALDREFERTQRLFLFYCPQKKDHTLRLSHFVLKDGKLDIGSEKMLLDYPLEDPKLNHQGGGLFMAGNGDLILGTGDSTPPIPELQVDQREGRETFDAQRTSANSMDLRGKILRIHPTEDGGYTVPAGNLFSDGMKGRAEIFAMGVRNGFRVFADPRTGWVYWGDVGQNIVEEIGVGPNGYDEINQARTAGNFGWPYFTGPNEAYRNFDFASRTAGAPFDLKTPRNDSRNNTGAHELPPPQPAFIWYPSVASKEFPTLGSGGRAAMVGPVYRFDPGVTGDLKLPEHFNNCLFIFEWMRNWIQAVKLDADGHIAGIEPFLPMMKFRKPIELKLAPDHTLYVIETGDKWMFNNDSQIFRLVYRRGNRAPVAVADATPRAGKQPLRVKFDARRSSDKDGDVLTYAWKFGADNAEHSSNEAAPEFVFENTGVHPVTLTVTDSHGASTSAHLEIPVGNSPPQVTLELPSNGSFYDPAQQIPYRITVADTEDGSSADGLIPPGRVLLKVMPMLRTPGSANEEAMLPPGLKLMRATTCFGCHITNDKSVGPPYLEVSKRYRGDATARERLAQKIITGGGGVWSKEVPMPPHPQHTLEQTRQMVDWILSLADLKVPPPLAGFTGTLTAPAFKNAVGPIGNTPTVLAIFASYTDNGAAGMPPLRGEAVTVLHARLKNAAYFDDAGGADVVDLFEGWEGNVVRLKVGGWFRFDTINLKDITHLTCRVAPLAVGTSHLEVHLDSHDGPLLGSKLIKCTGETDMKFVDVDVPITAASGARPFVCVVRRLDETESDKALPHLFTIGIIDVKSIEFHSDPPSAATLEK